MFDAVDDSPRSPAPDGPWVVIDGYHAFMAIDGRFAGARGGAFYLGGGYKYAMAGEGMGFMHCPPGFGPRPPVTGWFAEFDDLTAPPGRVGYRADAMRFMGATFDPSALYRFNAIRRMLRDEGLTTAAHLRPCRRAPAPGARRARRHRARRGRTAQPARRPARTPASSPSARPRPAAWQRALADQGCVTDVRGDVLRIGFGLYQDEATSTALAASRASSSLALQPLGAACASASSATRSGGLARPHAEAQAEEHVHAHHRPRPVPRSRARRRP